MWKLFQILKPYYDLVGSKPNANTWIVGLQYVSLCVGIIKACYLKVMMGYLNQNTPNVLKHLPSCCQVPSRLYMIRWNKCSLQTHCHEFYKIHLKIKICICVPTAYFISFIFIQESVQLLGMIWQRVQGMRIFSN